MEGDETFAGREEAKEILRSLRELLRAPGFAAALAVVLCGKSQGEENDLSERVAPGGEIK